MEVTYTFMDKSEFNPRHPVAWLPDALVMHFFHETPDHVKKAIEDGFFNGASINDFETGGVEVMNAIIINALIGLQRDMKSEMGENDFYGMLTAYEMPQHFDEQFRILAEMSDAEQGCMTETEFNEAMGDEIN